MTPTIQPILYKVSTAAKMLDLSRWTVNDMCRRFEIGWVPVGRRGRRIPGEEIERWKRENTVTSAAQLRVLRDRRRGKS